MCLGLYRLSIYIYFLDLCNVKSWDFPLLPRQQGNILEPVSTLGIRLFFIEPNYCNLSGINWAQFKVNTRIKGELGQGTSVGPNYPFAVI